jgi:UrcA family protein
MSDKLLSSGIAALSFTVSAALLALTLAPVSAAAATADEVTVTITGNREIATKRVSTADLDLANAADLRRLEARVRGAVADVCDRGSNGRITLPEARCRDEARRSSDRQLAALRSEAQARTAANQARSTSEITVLAAR